jgi:hypothetical protein
MLKMMSQSLQKHPFSLLSLFQKNKRRLMRSSCCVRLGKLRLKLTSTICVVFCSYNFRAELRESTASTVGHVISYAAHVVSKEIMRLVLSRTSCAYYETLLSLCPPLIFSFSTQSVLYQRKVRDSQNFYFLHQ